MEIRIRDNELNRMITKFQEGGEMAPPEEQMPAEGGAPEGGAPQGGDPMQQLVEMFVQGLQNQDCNLLAQAAQMFLQAVQGGGGGGEAPAPAPGEPVYKRGGRLVRWQ